MQLNDISHPPIITKWFLSVLNKINMDDICFRQDDPIPHCAYQTMQCVKGEKKGITRNVDVNWTPRSCDFIPLDYFFIIFIDTNYSCFHHETQMKEKPLHSENFTFFVLLKISP